MMYQSMTPLGKCSFEIIEVKYIHKLRIPILLTKSQMESQQCGNENPKPSAFTLATPPLTATTITTTTTIDSSTNCLHATFTTNGSPHSAEPHKRSCHCGPPPSLLSALNVVLPGEIINEKRPGRV